MGAAEGLGILPCLSSGYEGRFCSAECSVDLSGQEPLEALTDLLGCVSLSSSPFDVFAGVLIVGHSGQDRHVQSAIEPPVAASIEPVSRGVFG